MSQPAEPRPAMLLPIGAFAARGAAWGTGVALALAFALGVSVGLFFVPIGTVVGAVAGAAAGVAAGLAARRMQPGSRYRPLRIGAIAALGVLVPLVPLVIYTELPFFLAIGVAGTAILAPLTIRSIESPVAAGPADRLTMVGIGVVIAAVVVGALHLLEILPPGTQLVAAVLAFAAAAVLAVVFVRRVRGRAGIEGTVALGILGLASIALGAGMIVSALALGS